MAKKKKRPPKPKVPRKVYSGGKLHYTIMDYWYVPKGDIFFKSGWRPVKKFNFNHPKVKKIINEVVARQEEIIARKNYQPTWEHMNRPMDF